MRYVVVAGAIFLMAAGASLLSARAESPQTESSDRFVRRAKSACETIDLREGSLKDVAPTHQLTTGDCYVHAAVGMMQGFLRKNGYFGTNRQLSPDFIMAQALSKGLLGKDGKAISVSFKEEQSGRRMKRAGNGGSSELLDSFFDADFPYGRACHVVGRLRKDGTCNRAFVRKKTDLYAALSGAMAPVRFTSDVDYYLALRYKTEGAVASASSAHCFAQAGPGPAQGLLQDFQEVHERIMSNHLEASRVQRSIYQSYLKNNGGDQGAAELDFEAALLRETVDQDLEECNSTGQSVRLQDMESFPGCSAIGFINKGDHQELLPPKVMADTLHYLLEKDGAMSTPPAIEFCSSVLSGPSNGIIESQRRNFGDSLSYLNDPKQSGRNFSNCGYHVALVVGRKWDGGSCKLMVRDSRSCRGINCEKDSSGKRNTADNVYLIDEEQLARNVVRIAALGEFESLRLVDAKDTDKIEGKVDGKGTLPPSLLHYRDELLPVLKMIKDYDGLGG